MPLGFILIRHEAQSSDEGAREMSPKGCREAAILLRSKGRAY